MRGDYSVNETKLRNLVGEELHAAEITADAPLVAGYIGPYGLSKEVAYYCDLSLKGMDSLVAGANREGFHLRGLNLERELGQIDYADIAKVKPGGICPCCKKPALAIQRGIEVGNIFQLGTKYSEPMHMQFAAQDGTMHYPVMGCYGIGIGRLAASVCEAHHDEHGPVFPMTIAPWEVHICCIRPDDEETKKAADRLYEELAKQKIEVLYDDREGVRGGQMFADADLIGVPIRVIVSPRTVKEDKIEVTTRDKAVQEMVEISESLAYIMKLRKRLYEEFD